MRGFRRLAFAVLAFTGASFALPAATTLSTAEKRDLEREARLVVDLLQNYHYSDRAFRDLDAREVLTRYLDTLDPEHLIFTQDDIDFILLRFGRSLKSVYLFKGDLQPAFEINDLFLERARARLTWVDERLAKPFDFTTDETWRPAPAGGSVKASEVDARWEQYLKGAVLNEMLAGRAEAAAVAEVKRRYAQWRRQLASIDALAVRERFFEVVINTFDPHSGYFSADTAKEFAVDMEGAVAGLGLDLKKDAGKCLVAAVQPGGPADLQGELQPGDELLALAAADGPWVETKGQRLREIVATVRGAPNTTLRVAFRPRGSDARREVSLQRARVILPAEHARGALFAVPDDAGGSRKIGWIELPSFYTAGENGALSSAARDVRELIEQMQARGVEALVLDLRLNPGGALTEAVALSGLFIPSGPVMLTRGLDGKVDAHTVKEDRVLWSGPLTVLTSNRSASASEIFAGAMRFHQRAVVVGATTTFGKGTVQNYMDLARFPGRDGTNAAAWGVLRLTSQRFYQPDGSAVQRTGAQSHLVLPDYGDDTERSEAQLPHALPAESIPPPAGTAPAKGKFTPVDAALLTTLKDRLEQDAATLPEFALRKRVLALEHPKDSQQPLSLNLEKRRAEFAAQRATREELRRLRREESARHAYAAEAIDLAEVRAALAAHQAKLKTVRPDGTSPLNRLSRHAFLAEAPGGAWRELEVAGFDFSAFSGDTAELAAAFATGSGRATDAAALSELLTSLALLDEPDTAALLAATGETTAGKGLGNDVLTRALEAMFQRMVELEPDLLRDHRAFDVPLRESLRLAAACVPARS